MKTATCIFLLTLLFFACQKDATLIKEFELLNGNYTGTIYKWQRDYDSTHTQVVEIFDTIYNASSVLEINQDSNLIRFGGVLYHYHDTLGNHVDTIRGRIQNTTNPYNSIEIIKSIQFVRLYSSAASGGGDPWAYTQKEEYFKD